MTRGQRTAIWILGITAALLLAAIVIAGAQLYGAWLNGPLGDSVPTSPYTPLQLPATWTATAAGIHRTGARSTATSAPRCGGPDVMNLLLIGSDTRSTGYTWGLSDVMRIARIDFRTPELSMLDFPRDLWVQIPEISDDLGGQDHEKLNQAYLYGNPGDGFGYWSDPSAGPGLLARTLDLNFGVKVDHYLAINMRTFVRMVDAVGGIDVTLSQRVGGSHNPNLQAGRHHLDGAEALAVARDRADGVFSRGNEQNLVLCALQKKMTSAAVVAAIPQLIQSFRDSVQTDLSPMEMSQLACLATQMPRSSIRLYSFPEALFTGSRVFDPVFQKNVFIWDADFLMLRNYVAAFQSGSWPSRTVGGASSENASYCE